MFARFKKWFRSDAKPHHAETPVPKQTAREELKSRMIGEPVTSFLASLAREPKRYKLERVLTLNEFPRYTCYDWMHKGAGTWKFTDTKTGLSLGAYVHEAGMVHAVYGLPFDLNHWELEALYNGFYENRNKAQERLDRMRESACRRARELKCKLEKIDRLRYAEMFKEDQK